MTNGASPNGQFVAVNNSVAAETVNLIALGWSSTTYESADGNLYYGVNGPFMCGGHLKNY